MNMLKSSALLLFIIPAISFGQLISSFGPTVDDEGSGWTYNPSNSTLTGVETFGSYLTGEPLSTDYTGATGLLLIANVTTNPFSVFSITLEDNLGRVAVSNFTWADFIGGASIQSEFFTIQSGFNFANVAGFTIDGGSSNNSINVTFTSLSAIPEPSSYGVIFAFLTTLFLARRRR